MRNNEDEEKGEPRERVRDERAISRQALVAAVWVSLTVVAFVPDDLVDDFSLALARVGRSSWRTLGRLVLVFVLPFLLRLLLLLLRSLVLVAPGRAATNDQRSRVLDALVPVRNTMLARTSPRIVRFPVRLLEDWFLRVRALWDVPRKVFRREGPRALDLVGRDFGELR